MLQFDDRNKQLPSRRDVQAGDEQGERRQARSFRCCRISKNSRCSNSSIAAQSIIVRGKQASDRNADRRVSLSLDGHTTTAIRRPAGPATPSASAADTLIRGDDEPQLPQRSDRRSDPSEGQSGQHREALRDGRPSRTFRGGRHGLGTSSNIKAMEGTVAAGNRRQHILGPGISHPVARLHDGVFNADRIYTRFHELVTFRSDHPGGVNMVMVDGSVHLSTKRPTRTCLTTWRIGPMESRLIRSKRRLVCSLGWAILVAGVCGCGSATSHLGP